NISAGGKFFGVVVNKLSSADHSHPESHSASKGTSVLFKHNLVGPGLETKRAIVSERGKRGPIVQNKFVVDVKTIRAADFPRRLHEDVVGAGLLRRVITGPT